jgi:hypothetical protein
MASFFPELKSRNVFKVGVARRVSAYPYKPVVHPRFANDGNGQEADKWTYTRQRLLVAVSRPRQTIKSLNDVLSNK